MLAAIRLSLSAGGFNASEAAAFNTHFPRTHLALHVTNGTSTEAKLPGPGQHNMRELWGFCYWTVHHCASRKRSDLRPRHKRGLGRRGAVQPQCVHRLFSHQPKAFTAAYMPPPQPCSICHRQEPSFAAETHHRLHPLIATYSFPAQQLHLAAVCVQVVGSAHPTPVPGTPLLQPSQQQMALMMLTK
jgi:hypothetical protein